MTAAREGQLRRMRERFFVEEEGHPVWQSNLGEMKGSLRVVDRSRSPGEAAASEDGGARLAAPACGESGRRYDHPMTW